MNLGQMLREETTSPIEPEVLTPEQHADRTGRVRSAQPEVRLMLAVLDEAIATYLRCAVEAGAHRRVLLAEVERWFGSTDTDWPYSFANICDVLGLDADGLRRGLAAWRERQAPRGRAAARPRLREVLSGRRRMAQR